MLGVNCRYELTTLAASVLETSRSEPFVSCNISNLGDILNLLFAASVVSFPRMSKLSKVTSFTCVADLQGSEECGSVCGWDPSLLVHTSSSTITHLTLV